MVFIMQTSNYYSHLIMLGLTRITMTMLMQNIHKCPHAYTRGEREREGGREGGGGNGEGEGERERDLGMDETHVPLTN